MQEAEEEAEEERVSEVCLLFAAVGMELEQRGGGE